MGDNITLNLIHM